MTHAERGRQIATSSLFDRLGLYLKSPCGSFRGAISTRYSISSLSTILERCHSCPLRACWTLAPTLVDSRGTCSATTLTPIQCFEAHPDTFSLLTENVRGLS